MVFNAGFDSRSDEELLVALRQPATAKTAFEALFLRYHARLCGFAHHFVKNEAVAEEIVQDTFLFIWDRRASWRVRGESFRPYVFMAVKNAALSYLRHRRVEEAKAPDVGDVITLTRTPAPADAQAQRSELNAAIQKAVRELPDRCREVFVLHREQNMSYNEIAEVLGIAPKTVEIHMNRAFKLLRGALAGFKDANTG